MSIEIGKLAFVDRVNDLARNTSDEAIPDSEPIRYKSEYYEVYKATAADAVHNCNRKTKL